MDLSVYKEELFTTVQQLLKIDSPTGYCRDVMEFIRQKAEQFGYGFYTTEKGCGVMTILGRDSSRTIMLSGHVDTLGLMVRSITEDGMLAFVPLGGPIIPTLDGEYCRIRTRSGKVYTGTILSQSPAAHVYPDSRERARTPDEMSIRLDEVVRTKEDVQALGIRPGDFVCIDPKTEVTESGFLKSRFIDDKGGSACMLMLASILSGRKLTPRYRTLLFFSVYEEVGHGAAYVPEAVTEMLAVDMGCIGLDLSCTEYDVSICAKDSSGPYDYDMVGRLIQLAEENQLSYAVDIYPMYSSDVSASLKGGQNIRGGLIGPGVHASHGMERTHWEGLKNTLALMLAYVEAQ